MRVLVLLLIPLIVSACVSISPEAQKQRLHKGLNDREILALEAILYDDEMIMRWLEDHPGTPKREYQYKDFTDVISNTVERRIRTKIPEFDLGEKIKWYYKSIITVECPDPMFGYVEIVSGDGFYSTLEVIVFEKEQNTWQRIDSFVIAEGNLEVGLVKFDWSDYYNYLMKKRSREPSSGFLESEKSDDA